jgi:hypothetical protein
MFVDGIGISGYRSFGSNLPRIGPFSKINLLIGQNNSGKSNILLFMTRHYQQCVMAANRGGDIRLEPIDRHLGDDTGNFAVAFGLELRGKSTEILLINTNQNWAQMAWK